MYFNRLETSKPLPRAEEEALADRVHAGDQQARDRLVEANLRFVVTIARKYEPYLDLSELISAGNIGLVTAAERFDKAKGCKFISYAVWWIRQSILQTIAEQARLIRLPIDKVNMLNALRKKARRLARGDRANMEEMVEEMAVELDLPVEEIELVMQADKTCYSLDEYIFEGEDLRLIDMLPDTVQAWPDVEAMRNSDKTALEDVFSCLKEREQIVLRFYFGLNDGQPMTLEAIGTKLNITRERVRQIKAVALLKLSKQGQMPAMRELKEDWEFH